MKFNEGVHEHDFLQLLQDGGRDLLLLKINILSAKIGNVCITVKK